MNSWGFIITDAKTERILVEDFGYDTEEEAEEYGRIAAKDIKQEAYLAVEQRWIEIE